ncbi:GNAT family N-acetyltransferase [Coleofasciculus sp. E1-EBD-02]|uniref:GNAT family N-acetyltransferase n=1 Tax=Coleofasciculus sp. E1-EBD-02 TaxID=3068481 RepID=UPI0032F4B112
MISSRTKENSTILSFVNKPQTLTVPCSLFPVPCSLISTVHVNCVHLLIGYLTYLHGILYAKEYGWDNTFEAYVACPLAEFAKSQTDRERIWIVEKDGKVAGSIAIVEASQENAQLRWLLLHPNLRGYGIGKTLVEAAIRFCQNSD